MDNVTAHKLRQLNRDDVKKSVKRAAKEMVADYVGQNPMQSPYELQHHYEAINELLEDEFDTAQNFQLARRGFLEFVRDYNKTHQLYLNEPVVPILATRERLTINYDWFVNGRAVADSSAIMMEIWQRKRRFSVNDLIEGLLYCSIIYGGVNDIYVLKALYDWLFGERLIYQISLPAIDENRAEKVAVIPLSVSDDNYGCALDSSDDLQRFIDYVPDDMSLCFLYALKNKPLTTAKIKQFNTIVNDISKKLKLTNKNIDRPQHSLLIKYANYHWRQLEGGRIDGALAVVKQNDIKTTSLPTDKLIRYNQEAINPNPKALTWSELFDASYQAADKPKDNRDAIAYPSFSKNLIRELQGALKLTRSTAISTLTTLKADTSQPNARRLLGWALSLLDDRSIRLNTISKYLGCIGRDWLMLTMDEDIDQWEGSDFEDIYEQVIQSKVKDGRKLSVLSKSSELDDNTSTGVDNDNNIASQSLSHFDRLKDSQKFTYGRLKAFHDHQRMHFDAPYVYFPWGSNRQVVKANMISLRVYHAMKEYVQLSELEVEQQQLCLTVLALAYRTGMRINEIIGINVDDIADIGLINGQMVEVPKIILKPNRYRRLKSSSAKRVIPIDSLFKDDELKLFIAFYYQQKRLKRRYLFSQGSGDQPLLSVFFSNMMKIIWDRLLITHDFTFHSFRHTAISQLALVLSGSPLAQIMTDYDTAHSDAIVKALLANSKEQGMWFGLASFAGHLTPDTTFEYYIHTAHLLAGWQMSKAKLDMPITVFDMVTGIGYQTVNRQDGRAYSPSTKQIHLDKMRGYLINKVASRESLLSYNRTPVNTDYDQNTQNDAVNARPSIFIHPKIYDVIAFLKELQKISIDKRAEWFQEVALRHGVAINEARRIYDKARQVSTDDRLLLSAPTGHKNQEILVKALDRAYQMSINEPARLKSFVEIFTGKQNLNTSSIHFGIKETQIKMLQQFVTVGCQLIDASHWQIRAYSEQAVRNIKKELGLDSAIRVGARENFHGYEVRVVQKKRKHSDRNMAVIDDYYSSSGVLKYLGHILMISNKNSL